MTRFTAGSLCALAICAQASRAQSVPQPMSRDTAQRLRPVVVTATRDTISPLASPLPTSERSASELRRDHGVSLSQSLSGLAGVRSLSTGEQVGKPVIRGLTGPRVLVLDDGLRLEDYSWSDEDGPSVDARLAERVEVIRGPASVLYGSDALGGVINVIPASLLDARGGPTVRRGQFEIYGASNNGEVGTTIGLEGARGRLGGRAIFVGRFGQNVHTPTGVIRNTGYAAANGEAAIGLHHEGGAESTLRFAHYGGEFQLLETDAPAGGTASADEGGPARVTLDDRLQLTHRRAIGVLDIEARGQLQRHALAERADDPSPAPGKPKETTVFDLLLNTATIDLLAHHGARAGASGTQQGIPVQGTFGVSGLLQQNDSRGIIPLVPDAATTSGGAFAFERVSFGRLSLLGGLRGDVRHVSATADPRLALTDQSRTFGAITGDVGAVYRLQPELALAVNVGRAWRAPSLFELYASGPRLGEGRYEFGRAALDPETSVNLDASLRWESSRVRGELSGFRTRVAHFIFIAPTNATQDNLRVYRYDQANALLLGGEASASVVVSDALTVHGRLDGVQGTQTATDDPLPLMAPFRAALGAELRAPSGHYGRPYVSVDLENTARQSRLSFNEREAAVQRGRFPLATDAYTLLDLAGGLDLPLRSRPTHLDVRVRNATNRQYRDFLNRYKEFAYAPGANVVLRVTTVF